jgi:hypothetical protein
MRFLVDVHRQLSYTYPQKHTSNEIRREMLLALGCMKTRELDDEKQDNDVKAEARISVPTKFSIVKFKLL